jgi:hypothetical protein
VRIQFDVELAGVQDRLLGIQPGLFVPVPDLLPGVSQGRLDIAQATDQRVRRQVIPDTGSAIKKQGQVVFNAGWQALLANLPIN